MDATISDAVKAVISKMVKAKLQEQRASLARLIKEAKADPLDPVKVKRASDAAAYALGYEAAMQDLSSLFEGSSTMVEPAVKQPKPARKKEKKIPKSSLQEELPTPPETVIDVTDPDGPIKYFGPKPK
jgi:hypothetical protein